MNTSHNRNTLTRVKSFTCRRSWRLLVPLCVAVVAGCSGMRSVDVDVTSFATWGNAGLPAPGSSYRFERLPSQQQPAVQQDQIETLVRDALARKALQLNAGTARYSVQVSSTLQQVANFGGYPSGPTVNLGAYGGSGGFGGAGIGLGFPIGGGGGSFEYRSELLVLIRHLPTNTVVYETRAYAQAGGPGDTRVLAAMADSALRDFPVPPTGVRRFVIPLP
ncbi:MAG: DUF4136 domain-containing protein [Pseudomonadota bacterium]